MVSGSYVRFEPFIIGEQYGDKLAVADPLTFPVYVCPVLVIYMHTHWESKNEQLTIPFVTFTIMFYSTVVHLCIS